MAALQPGPEAPGRIAFAACAVPAAKVLDSALAASLAQAAAVALIYGVAVALSCSRG